ncbi:MAG TPA: hypothetical protein VGD78_19335 [Chthoniobacterales bacterium]
MTIVDYRIRIEHASREGGAGNLVIIPLDTHCQEIVLCSRGDEPVATIWQVVEATVERTGERYPVELITKDELHRALHDAGNVGEGDRL